VAGISGLLSLQFPAYSTYGRVDAASEHRGNLLAAFVPKARKQDEPPRHRQNRSFSGLTVVDKRLETCCLRAKTAHSLSDTHKTPAQGLWDGERGKRGSRREWGAC
jgi:hypothetical protein